MNQILLFMLIVLSNFVGPQDAKKDMTINISQIKDQEHKIYVAVCKESPDFPDNADAVKFVMVEPNGKTTASISISDLPYGKYAIKVFQDLNGNKKLDKNFLGIPKEPFAFSNNFHPRFGPPKWKDCEIEYSPANNVYQINGFIKL